MKTQLKTLQAGLLCLFLLAGSYSFAQVGPGSITKGNLKLGPSSIATDGPRKAALGMNDEAIALENTNVVLFYKQNNEGTESATSVTLVASVKEDHPTREIDLDFTSYKWYYMGQNPASTTSVAGYGIDAGGTEKVVEGNADANKIIASKLTEGYHVFKVEGYISIGGVAPTCAAQEEYFVVYVLPRLDVTAEPEATTGSLQYCETEAEGQKEVNLSANVAYLQATGMLPTDVNDLDFKYTWYSVKIDGASEPTIDPTKGSLEGAVSRLSSTTSNTFSPEIAEIGQYKFFVEVEYTLKDRNYDETDAEDPTARKRTYAIFRGWVGEGANRTQANASIITVTPAPGKPHITIINVVD